MVAVISSSGIPLMPTSNYKVRKLLRCGRAKIHRYQPFTIQLLDRENGETQPMELCMDTGYLHIGLSVKSEKHEYLAYQIDTLDDEKKNHQDQLMYRRTRRNRKRYRKPRFCNRLKSKDWIAPSLKHKLEIHEVWIKKICAVMPVTSITLEMGNFDTQVLKAMQEGRPLPEGKDYQQGERYGIATLREAVFFRDNYTCQCCKRTIKDHAILHVHHIVYRSQGGTNRMSNLATVCEQCHTPANHQPGGRLWNWRPKLPAFQGAAYMNTVRWMFCENVKQIYPEMQVQNTYGACTKERRRDLSITKSHVNDAYVMGKFQPKHRSEPELFKKRHRNNRCLEKFYDAKYTDSRTGKKTAGKELSNGRISRNHKKDSENLHPYRQKKLSIGRRSIRKQHYKIQPGDIVIVDQKKQKSSGCHNKGSRVMVAGKSYSIKEITVFKYCGGYLHEPINRKEAAG